MVSRIEVHVDEGMCMGVESCVRHAPGAFALDADRRSTAVVPPTDELETVLSAARSCPNFAITVYVDGKVAFDPDTQ